MYEDENNLYHYSYRKGDGSDTPDPVDTKNYAEEPYSGGDAPKKKGGNHGTVKIVALALVCALVGGFAGAGVSRAAKVNKTSIQVSSREVAQVQTLSVDGKTEMTMSEVYAANVNSVVSINVSATSTNNFGQTVETAASGTGFFITEDGYILTNHHVVSGASSVKVTLYSGETYDATVIGSDEDYDIAVLKIDVTGATPVVLGDSSKLAIGESVAAVGNPLGELTFSMSEGIVSCVNRAINVDGTPFNMIQVDCSINPGNSGGPTDKAYMAITAGTMTAQMAAQYSIDITQGVFVYSVVDGGAGDKAGLRLGDVITKMNDTDLTSRQDMSAAMKSYRAGDTVTLTVYRNGQYITTELTFDAQPQTTGSDTEDSTNDSNGGNGGYYGQMPDNWQDFYNYFFGSRRG